MIYWGIGEACVDSAHQGVSSTLWGNSFLHNPQGSCFGALDPHGVLDDIGGILFRSVTHWGVRVDLTHEEFS